MMLFQAFTFISHVSRLDTRPSMFAALMGNMHIQRCVQRRARFTPMNFVLPPLLWLGVSGRSLPWRVLNWAIVVGYSLIAVAGALRHAL